MKKYLFITIAAFFCCSCTKEFLDKKPDQSLVVPQTLQDFQALLDNTSVNNINMPALSEIGSDDNYITDASFGSVTVPMYANSYIWSKDIYAGNPNVLDWNNRYQQIFYSNIVLEGLSKLGAAQQADPQWSAEKGSALFFRGFALYEVAQSFCKPYVQATATSDLGVPVRTSSDINKKSIRGTVAQTYAQVVADLKASIGLLPATVPVKTRPDQAAAYGMLARVYLSMSDYPDAQQAADDALKMQGALIDFNNLNTNAAFPLTRYNAEVIWHATEYSTSFSSASRLLIDSNLFKTYIAGDLRGLVFYKKVLTGNTFKGSYSGSALFFDGIATDELYLTRAEAYARQNNVAAAMADLNTLLTVRFKTGSFIPYTAASADQALDLILAERRKELVFRALRWTDLRRLNLDSKRAMTLSRIVNGNRYTLAPNDQRYVLPIPGLVIQLSGIAQNQR
jgi:tetratricopeptide (TPR) repeat protein